MRSIEYCISIVIGQKVEHKFFIEEFLINMFIFQKFLLLLYSKDVLNVKFWAS